MRRDAAVLPGPLVVAGVLLDYGGLRDHKVRPLGFLNDSKQCSTRAAGRALSRRARLRRAGGRARDLARRDRPQRPAPLEPRCDARDPACALAARGGVPRRRFPARPDAPAHQAVVDGDEKSAAIAAASIVAKVTRDRLMRRDGRALPAATASRRTSATSLPAIRGVVRERGPCHIHRRSFQALCYRTEEEPAALRPDSSHRVRRSRVAREVPSGRQARRVRALWWYRASRLPDPGDERLGRGRTSST